MENNSLPYFAKDDIYSDFSLFINSVLRSFISTKDKVSFDKILRKMQNNARFNIEIPIVSVLLKLNLTKFEQFCIILILSLDNDKELNQAFLKISNLEKNSLVKLYRATVQDENCDFNISADGRSVLEFTSDNVIFTKFFTEYIVNGNFFGAERLENSVELLVYKQNADEIAKNITTDGVCVNIYGEKSCGKRQFVHYIAYILDKKIMSLDFDKMRFSTGDEILDNISRCTVFSKIEQGIVYIYNINDNLNDKEQHILAQILENLQLFTVFVATIQSDTLENRKYQKFLKVNLWNLTNEEKISAWEHFKLQYNAEINANDFGNKYVFNVGEIKNTFESASLLSNGKIDESIILQSIKMRDYRLEGADLIKTYFTFDDLVVDEPVRRQLDHIINQLKFKNVMYDDWGFDKKIPYGRGISSLFYGPPGTGKTMTASVIANELKLDLYRIDLSKLISKYIGETEKNISNLFDKAKNMNVILFFDEADALFAKRSEVNDSNDKNANAETAHLLQKLEEYEGISILATNLLDQLDDAFKRRIKFMVPFVLPSEKVRLELWKRILPREEFLGDIDIEFFAKNFELSGSQIKEIVLNASFIAISEGEKLSNNQIKEAVTLNYQKYGKRILNDDFLYLA
ncbi:MAG: ATP-binding protein [Clostridia bacterium]